MARLNFPPNAETNRKTVPLGTARNRPRSAGSLANWNTRLFATGDGEVCAIVVPPKEGWPTVVLLHGWAMNRSAWATAALPLVDAGFGVLIPDLPGHGNSPDLEGDLGDRAGDHFFRMARQVHDVLDELAWDKVAVAGYSMGAMVALAVARQAPDRVQRLMLLDPIVRVPALQMLLNPSSHMSFYGKMARAFLAPESKMPSVFAALALSSLPLPTAARKTAIERLMTNSGFGLSSVYESYVGEEHETDVDAFLKGLSRTNHDAIMRCFEAKNRSDFMTDLFEFRGPLSLLTAENDPFCPPRWLGKVAEKARRSGVQAQFSVIDDCGHLSICHRPAEVAAALIVWLDRPVIA